MQRRIKAQPKEPAACQALIDHKQATLNVILSGIPDISTFAQLGELIGYSHEWVTATAGTCSREALQAWKAL